MALFNRLPDDQIASLFTHHAKLHGVPIYFNINDNSVCVKNWYPEFFLDIGEIFFQLTCNLLGLHDQMYAIKLLDEIKPTEEKPDGQ